MLEKLICSIIVLVLASPLGLADPINSVELPTCNANDSVLVCFYLSIVGSLIFFTFLYAKITKAI